MKAIFIAYNQAYYKEIIGLLEAEGVRGYTEWDEIQGRGSVDGEAHEGSHAWPTMNNAILTFVEDGQCPSILEAIRSKDTETPELGLRAFSWSIDQ